MKDKLTIEYIKSLGKNKSDENFDKLLDLYKLNLNLDLKREVVSSIGRQTNIERLINFLEAEALTHNKPMELIYQMYRTCLSKSKLDERFVTIGERIENEYHNEVIDKMKAFYCYKQSMNKKKKVNKIERPMLLIGDASKTLKELPDNSIQLAFTSPPYYNAREYSNYCSYNEYLSKMKDVLVACNRVIEDGRFLIVNISPIITRRPGREYESIRYPIHFDFHKILEEAGFYFIDEIIWIKPEPSVPNRNGGYQQTRKPLSYKPNCITESLMVYRKKCDFLLDKNIDCYGKNYNRYDNEDIDMTNCWYIAPKSDKNHPAVFPEELCRRILKYYSYEKDVVLDPFAGLGTFGRVAKAMNRLPVMCEINERYANIINEEEEGYYDIYRGCYKQHS